MRSGSQAPLVTVIIPAFNAEGTLDETLSSVRAQTYSNLDIIVVDDGSRDRTANIARAHAARDPRVRVVEKPNGGVASARNKGVALSNADYIALIDADDLWRPEKIERQMGVMLAGGPDLGLVYTWSALIDLDDRIVGFCQPARHDGMAFDRLCAGNFIGNGSSPLIRKAAIIASGGYNPDPLVDSCEDFGLYLAVAEFHEIACVPEYLTGYRIGGFNKSNNLRKVMRSYTRITDSVAHKYPHLKARIRRGKAQTALWYVERAARRGGPGMGMATLREAIALGAPSLGRIAAHPRLLRHLLNLLVRGRNALLTSPEEGEGEQFFAGHLAGLSVTGVSGQP